MITSPFKLLDAYTAADKTAFWGRDEEIADLYGMVTKNRLMLVYGQSGTGKTSLVQCGLASRFDLTDWYPVFVRRQNDLNQSLETALAGILREPGRPGGENALALALENIYETYLRPVYLIFDQLEELFVLGTAKEQDRFIKSIRGVLDTATPCRILFIIREEYLAHLYNFERTIPTLFDRRLRVEPMGLAKVTQVLEGSFKQYNIEVPEPAQPVYQQIVDNVSGGKAGVQLPYLQVYLDLLYREDFARTYPGQSTNGKWLPLEFTAAEIGALGKIDNVLEKFLLEQGNAIQQALQQQFKNTDPEAVRKVLDAFVSEEGTKRPVAYEWKGDALQVEPRWSALFQPMTADALGYCCRRLEQARLLRFSDHYVELAHDALAALIDQKRSAEERRLQETYARLLHNFREFGDTGEYLSRKQLNAVEEYLPLMENRLGADVKTFIRDSAEKLRQLEQAELVAERRKRRRAILAATIGFLLAAVAIVAAVVAYKARQNMARKAFEVQLSTANMLKVEGKYEEALTQLQSLESFSNVLPATERTSVAQLQTDWRRVWRYVATGDSIRAVVNAGIPPITPAGELPTALAAYEQAKAISPDAHLEALAQQTRKDIAATLETYILFGETMVTNGKYPDAILYFETARKLKPEDARAQQRLDKYKIKIK